MNFIEILILIRSIIYIGILILMKIETNRKSSKRNRTIKEKNDNKCYGFDEELGICLIWGIYCDQNKRNYCYHENMEDYKKIKDKENK